MMTPLMSAGGFYMKELMKYPPQFKIGFLSNNPPIYDLAPKAREMMKKNMETRGVGRANP
jgi:arylsulfatase